MQRPITDATITGCAAGSTDASAARTTVGRAAMPASARRRKPPVSPRAVAAAATMAVCAWASAGCGQADLDRSGVVDGADIGLLLSAWGPAPAGNPADLDASGSVDGADLGALVAAWGPVNLVDCLTVTEVTPSSAAIGQTVKLTGTFPDASYLDYSVAALTEDGTVIPFEVVNVTSTVLTTKLGPVPVGTAAGTIMVGLGAGSQGISGWPPGLRGQTTNVWTWQANGAGLVTDLTFTPTFPASDPNIGGTFYGTLSNGELSVTISGNCPDGTAFHLWQSSHHNGNGTPGDPYIGYECQIPCVSISGSSDSFSCATEICAAIQSAYLAHSPNLIQVNCNATPVANGTTLTLSLDGASIDWGVFIVETLSQGACGAP